jgi:hypothetical protein
MGEPLADLLAELRVTDHILDQAPVGGTRRTRIQLLQVRTSDFEVCSALHAGAARLSPPPVHQQPPARPSEPYTPSLFLCC